MLLYIHIPFCESKCYYCSFNSFAGKEGLKGDYAKALIKQFGYEKERFDIQKSSIDTVFIGGGTPSVFDEKYFQILFDEISPYLKKDAEITTEANPNSANPKWLKCLRESGVNRVSFGVQSFDDKKLRYLGRNHDSLSAKKAILNAFEAGFENISLDLIHGCETDDRKILKKDLDIAFGLPINHISTYHLSIEKGTRFYKNGFYAKNDIDEQRWFYQEIIDRGFRQYEISNFGKYISKHNLGYWRYEDYIGLGAGAVGFLKDRRFYPHKSVEKYIKEPCFFKEERLSAEDIKTEKVFLGLRSIAGFKESILNEKEKTKADILLSEKKIYKNEGVIFNKDYLLSDEIALFILS
ncbi:MAG: coproporphyrinogen III oxidase family protein [Epsilonproteobacteria bacterium]|nr:coproporphyrinogen III oxidase family protein [Campylobacterota bacterium]